MFLNDDSEFPPRVDRARVVAANQHLPLDTAHFATRCSSCNWEHLLIRGVSEAWSALTASVRVSTHFDVLALLHALARDVVKPSKPLCQCTRGRKPMWHITQAWWCRAVLEADLDVVLHVTDAQGIDVRAPEHWKTRVLFVPPVGAVQLDPHTNVSEAMLARFERDLAVGPAWDHLVSQAENQERVAIALASHQLAAAFPRADSTQSLASMQSFVQPKGLDLVATSASMVRSTLSAQWSNEVRNGSIVAAMWMSSSVLTHAIQLFAARVGIVVRRENASCLELKDGACSITIDLAAVALSGIASRLTLHEIALAAVQTASARLLRAQQLVQQIGSMVPNVTFEVQGLTLRVPNADRSKVRGELDLSPLLDASSTETIVRAVRFAFSEQTPWADATHVCRCGAAAWVGSRVQSARWLEAEIRRDPRNPPHVLASFSTREKVVCVRVAVLACDAHETVITRSFCESQQWDARMVQSRLEQDRSREVLRAKVTRHTIAATHKTSA